jgi:hypothetical protein
MPNNATTETPKVPTNDDIRKLKIDAGYAGQIFGSRSIPSVNIAAIFILILLVSGISFTVFNSLIPPKEYWSLISPLMTLALGYIFGKREDA